MRNIGSIFVILLIILINFACTDNSIVYPEFGSQGTLVNTQELNESTSKKLEGIYTISDGSDHFGTRAVIIANGTFISILCEMNSSYFILQAGSKDSTIYTEGYWRFAETDNNASAALKIEKSNGATDILYSDTAKNSIIISGTYISSSGSSKTITLTYQKPISKRNSDFKIIAHRGGGRNSDKLPHSENSAELMVIANRFGANAIEIDVQITKDQIPIIYHDHNFSTRLIKGEFLIGPISNFTLRQIKTFGTLINDEPIPTLEEALDSIINKTNLKLVWIDTKDAAAVASTIQIIQKYQTIANSLGKTIEICIGIPSVEVLNEFMKVEGFKNIKSICELSVQTVKDINALAFGLPWTLGTMKTELAELHSIRKKGFVWTLDEQVFIDKFLQTSDFDGIVTNYPSVVAFKYYTKDE
ncbi:MAG: glycerophosphodiester phosphodiesterase family protein [Candidatus Kapabacteria bacterium]|nr:glycerophosphodiester phosphodiesterase family protein [Candidatus Kapabacteria bacterium]